MPAGGCCCEVADGDSVPPASSGSDDRPVPIIHRTSGALQPADTLSHSPFACFKPAIQVSSADFTVRTARLISLTLLERWHLVLRSVAARSNSSYERCSK